MPRPIQPLSLQLEGAEWAVPRVEMESKGRHLRWEYGFYQAQSPAAGVEMLADFVGLADATYHSTVAFAERWGVFHHRGRSFEGKGRDDVHAWRTHARLYVSILELGRHVLGGSRVAEVHRERVENALFRHDPQRLVMTRSGRRRRMTQRQALQRIPYTDAQAMLLLRALKRELSTVQLQPRLRRDARPYLAVCVGASSLRSALAWELAKAVSGAGALVKCAGCGALVAPEGTRGTRAFCVACREAGRPQVFAKRDYRRRLRARGG